MTTPGTAAIPQKDDAWWKLLNTQVDTFSKLFAMIGVIGTLAVGLITYLNYIAQQKDIERSQSVLDLHLSTDIAEISATQSAVIVTIDLMNKGKRAIRPYAHSDDKNGETTYTGEGMTISITRHALPTGNASIPEDADEDERVVSRYNILEKKYGYNGEKKWDQVYVLNPNITYKETEAFVLQRKALYEARVRFYAFRRDANDLPETWTNTETKYFYIN
jgi:cell division protein FtsB